MIKSLTNDLCIMADALAANGVIGFSAHEGHKTIQTHGIPNVLKHGEKFEIDYHDARYIEFWTRCGEYRIMCLIDYPEYMSWMREHPDTSVNDRTGGNRND